MPNKVCFKWKAIIFKQVKHVLFIASKCHASEFDHIIIENGEGIKFMQAGKNKKK
jgi:hypothetical protein